MECPSSKQKRIDDYKLIIQKSKHVLAPMVEQCDLPFRLLVRKYGCDLCYTQMFHSRVMFEDTSYTDKYFHSCKEDRPLVVQLCGNDPECIKKAAVHFASECDCIDLNLGCPQGIAKKGKYGSFLLPDFDRVESIAKALGSSDVPIPYSVKIRLLPSLEDTIKLCKMLEREGAQLITIHGRTREQNKERMGECNWEAIRQIREQLTIPVFANGGIGSYHDIEKCLEATGVNGVMTGEALLENPTLFMNGVSPIDGHLVTVDEMCLEYLDLEEQYPALASEIKSHMFKFLYRALCIFTEERSQLGMMNFNKKEEKEKLREMIKSLAIKMHERQDPWLLQNSTDRPDSWYNRHNRTIQKQNEKKEKTELK